MLESLYIITVVLFIVAFFLSAWFTRNCVQRVRRDPDTQERRRKKKVVRDSFLFLHTLVFFLAGTTIFFFALFLQTFSIFALGEPIAHVHVIPSEQEGQFQITITPLGKPLVEKHGMEPQTFMINGDKWWLEGNVIRFNPFLNYVGMEPVYQLTRVHGAYFSFQEEKENSHRTIYSFVDPNREEWWRWLYHYGETLPLIDMVSGSAVSQSAEEEAEFVVSILPTGLTIKKSPIEDS